MEENFMDQLSFDQVKELMFLSISYSNDYDLGKQCRSLFNPIEVNIEFPNDGDLGRFVRKYLQKFKK